MIDLTRYLVRLILVRLAMVLLGVVALGLTFDLLQSGPALVASEPGTLGPIRYSLLRLPILASDLLPVAALLGGILAAGDLLRRGELVAIWNLGMSGLQLSRRLIPAGLLLAVIQYVFDDVARPLAVEELRARQASEVETRQPGMPAGGKVWLRSGDDLVRLSGGPGPTGEFADLIVLRRDPAGLLLERLDARTARPEAGGWLLRDVTRYPVDGQRSIRQTELVWHGGPPVETVSVMIREPTELTLLALADAVANDGFGIAPVDRHATWLHARLAGLLVPFLMVLLPLGLMRFRRAGGGRRIVIFGLGLGFGFLVGESTLVALGQAGLVAPWLAGWGPTIALAGVVFSRTGGIDLRARWRRKRRCLVDAT